MDNGAALKDGIIWCFTWGQPAEAVMDGFSRLLAGGNLRWVIVPVTPEPGEVDHPWPLDSAST